MESKRKKPPVRKAPAAKLQPPKPEKKLTSDALIREDAKLIEELFASRAWTEIAFPLLQESIASVTGRFTNGRFYHGSFVKSKEKEFLSGYQIGLEEFYNRLQDFILFRNRLDAQKKEAEENKKGQLYNPLLDELEDIHENPEDSD